MRNLIAGNHGKWSAEDLVRRLGLALDIAGQAVERFAGTGYVDSRESHNDFSPGKLIGETALLLLNASTAAGDPDIARRIHDVAERLLPHARSKRMLFGMCVDIGFAIDYAVPHICLTRLGYRDKVFDTVLGKSLNSQVRAGQCFAWDLLEKEWFATAWRGTRLKSRQKYPVVRQLLLGRPMDLLSGSQRDMYEFTHALIYTTGFNLLRPQRLPRPVPEILAEAEGALARCLDEEDYDVGGEILMSWPLTRQPWSTAAVFGFRVLASVQDQEGFLSCKKTKPEQLTELTGDKRAEYLLATGYHTAYVMGFLCASALRTGLAPPVRIPRRAQGTGNHEPILRLLDADPRRRHWRNEFDGLGLPERNAIAGLLFAIALRRKVAERNFSGLSELLEMGHQLGLKNSPIARQAAELLERVTEAAPTLLASR